MIPFFKVRFKVSEDRLVICRTCDQYNDVTTQCKKCGCFMAAKTLMIDSECPLGKWKAYSNE